MNTRILIGIACLATVLPIRAESRRSKLLKLYDEMLGKTEAQMRREWCIPQRRECIQEIPSGERTWMRGQKMFVSETYDAGFLYAPGHPAYATSTTTGQVDRRGNISATTTTTETPAAEGGGFYLHWRSIFYFDADGRVYRWEIEQCASGSRKFSEQTTHTDWEVAGVRELRPDKKGAMKVITVQKPSAWLVR
jgi:hypothetical protein